MQTENAQMCRLIEHFLVESAISIKILCAGSIFYQLCSLELELWEQEVVGSVGSHLCLRYTLLLYKFTVFRQVF